MILAALRAPLATIIVMLLSMLAMACLALGIAAPASARPLIDCPLRNEPYSIDSPLIDILLNPAAKAAMDRANPALLKDLPSFFGGTTVPTFSVILSVRKAAAWRNVPPEALVTVAPMSTVCRDH